MRYLGLALMLFLTPCAVRAQYSEQYRACGVTAKTQLQLDACANEEATRVETERNHLYAKLLTKTEGDPPAAEKVKAAEGAWITYRDAYIEAMYPAKDKLAQYGSIFPMEADLLRAKLDRQEIEALKALLRQYVK